MQKRPTKNQTETATPQSKGTNIQSAKADKESQQSPTHFSTIKRGSYNSHFPNQSTTKNEPISEQQSVRQPFKHSMQQEKKGNIKK